MCTRFKAQRYPADNMLLYKPNNKIHPIITDPPHVLTSLNNFQMIAVIDCDFFKTLTENLNLDVKIFDNLISMFTI